MLPKNSLTWLMLLLLILLGGFVAWIYWALDKVEEARANGPMDLPAETRKG